MLFKPNDLVIISKNSEELRSYTDASYAGLKGKVVCKDIQDDYDGYIVEFTSKYGYTTKEFIRAYHLVPAPSKLLDNKKAKWETVAEKIQKDLWKNKLGD